MQDSGNVITVGSLLGLGAVVSPWKIGIYDVTRIVTKSMYSWCMI